MFNLRTKCKQCVYQKPDGSGCQFDISTYRDSEDKQYTDDFCKYKRTDGNKSKEKILAEESRLCLMLNCKDENSDTVMSFLKINDVSKLSEIIVFGNNPLLLNDIEDIFEFLDSLQKKWSLKVFSDESDDMESYAVQEIKSCNWYLLHDVGLEIDKDLIHTFNDKINSNFIQIESDINSSVIRNRFAFMELACNHNKPFSEKIKELDEESNEE